ncbi:flippase [Patescibacteria group bacterium]|nr:flippase [Patescibacteria group bacterium]
MLTQKTITQNTTYYTLALIFQKFLAFVYFTFLARGLAVDELGKYTFAFAFTTIFSVLIDVGLSSVLTREIAKDKSKTSELLSNILGVKTILMFVTYGLIVVLVNALNYPELTKILVYITALVMVLDNFSTTFWATLRGNQNLKYESLGIILFQTLTVVVGGILLYFKANIVYLAMVILLASAFNFLFSYFQMRWRLQIKPRIVYNKKLIKTLLKISFPFALTGIFARLNTQIDSVFLSKIGCLNQIACDTNVGIYSVASKITLAIHFIPLAFVAALFPAMSEYFINNKEKLTKTFEKAMKYLMIIGMPISAGIIALAPDFMPKIFGSKFSASVLPLQILMVSLTFIFLTFPIGAFLNATSRQLRNSAHIGIAVIVNIILNLILIPKITYTGAAISSLASTLVILCLGLYVIPQIIKYNKKHLIISFIKSFISALIMGIILYSLLYKLHFIILILLGAIIYFVILFLIKGFSKNDFDDLLISLKLKKLTNKVKGL